jgi:hypothetical protein
LAIQRERDLTLVHPFDDLSIRMALGGDEVETLLANLICNHDRRARQARSKIAGS